MWPLKEMSDALRQFSLIIMDEGTSPYFEDLRGRIEGLMRMVESSRQVVPQVMSLYESNVSNELNRIVRLLTVITVIFAPLTFITAWYEMNFTTMPETDHPLGYVSVTILMALIGITLTTFFWNRKWITL